MLDFIDTKMTSFSKTKNKENLELMFEQTFKNIADILHYIGIENAYAIIYSYEK